MRSSMKSNSLFAKVAGAFSMKIFSAAIAYPTAIIIARSSGADGYGVYGFVVAIVCLLIYPVMMGFDQLIVREGVKVEQHIKVRNYPLVQYALIVVATLALSVAVCVSLAASLYPNIFGRYTLALAIGIWSLPLFAVRRIYVGLLRSLNKQAKALMPENLVQPAIILCCAIFGFLVLTDTSGEIVVVYFLLGNLAAAIFALAFGSRYTSFLKRPEFRSHKSLYPAWMAAGGYMALMASSDGIAMYIDRIMLGVFRSPAEVGMYLVAARNTAFVLFVESAFLFVTMPEIAKLFTKKQKVNSLISLQTTIVSLASGVFVCVFALFGEDIMRLFGVDFIQAYLPLVILSSGFFIGSLFGAGPHILMMIGEERAASKIMIISLCVNVVLNLALIPIFGMIGAALATLISEVYKKIHSFIVLLVKTKINSSIVSFRLHYLTELFRGY